ncbi:hypothetical protein [Burkholderia sp. BCC1644]|uniref:hypothetical protein n=1 Tax=Burkholderia sp. BCC1644 TaxID=2676293 RepID=UPI0015906F6D|nr:hypothetical protein [Burkholderia sp. BCC1644]
MTSMAGLPLSEANPARMPLIRREQRLASKRHADARRVVDAVSDSMRETDQNGVHEAAAGAVR